MNTNIYIYTPLTHTPPHNHHHKKGHFKENEMSMLLPETASQSVKAEKFLTEAVDHYVK